VSGIKAGRQGGSAAGGKRDALIGWAAIATSTGAVFAWAACCVLPMALALAGVGFGATAVAAQRSWLTIIAALVLAGGWWLVWRRSRACRADGTCKPPSRLNLVLLGVASLLLVIALAWPQLVEPTLLRLIRTAGSR
jgi:mercuric ion transport protein